MDKIRAGIIGCGGMGTHHVKTLSEHGAFEFVAGCDVNPEALKNLPRGVPGYPNAEEMLDRHEFDLVCIIVPNHLYEPMVKLACARGASVFCEKPFGHSLASCRAMVAALQAANQRGWVGGQRKYLEPFRAARDILAGQALEFVNVLFTYWWGPAYGAIGWRGERAKSGGVAVIDSGWHVLDTLSWFLGDPASVFAQLSYLASRPDIDDKAAVQLRYPSGAIASVVISYTMPRSVLDLAFVAGRRSFYLSYDGLVGFEDGRETMRVAKEEGDASFPAMYDELAAAYRGAPSPYLTDMLRAERIMQVVSACYESDRTGKIVRLGE